MDVLKSVAFILPTSHQKSARCFKKRMAGWPGSLFVLMLVIFAKNFSWASHVRVSSALGTRERGTAWDIICWLGEDAGGCHWSDRSDTPDSPAESSLGDAHCFLKASTCTQSSILMPGTWTIRTKCASVTTVKSWDNHEDAFSLGSESLTSRCTILPKRNVSDWNETCFSALSQYRTQHSE